MNKSQPLTRLGEIMEETYRLLIEFKTLHPLRFWTAIFIATSLIIFAFWKLSKNKRKAKFENLGNQRTTSTVVAEKETIKPKLDIKKENPKFETPQTKVYSDTSIKVNLEVNEPKTIYVKPTETIQEKVIPKVETVEVNPKTKPKSEEQLPKAKVETTKSKNEVDFVNFDTLLFGMLVKRIPNSDVGAEHFIKIVFFTGEFIFMALKSSQNVNSIEKYLSLL